MLEVIFILLVIWGVFIAARRVREDRQIPPPDKNTDPPLAPKESPYAKAVALRRAKYAEQKEAREKLDQQKSVDGRQAAKPHGPKAKAFHLTEQQIDRFIEGLPKRTLEELRQQWLNLVRLDQGQFVRAARFRDALLEEWAARSRQARIDDDYFTWPSTNGGNGDGSLRFDAWHKEGMLSYLGYRVGATDGEAPGTRQRILDTAFAQVLPPVNDPDYHQAWGSPETAARLKRLANEIARFARHAKSKRSADMSSAVDDWESDLRYLYDTYYVRKFGFGWPRV